MLQDRDLSRDATRGNTRVLMLPSGGTITIPLPGSSGRFSIKQAGLASADGCSRTLPILVGVVIGATVGVVATAWYLQRR